MEHLPIILTFLNSLAILIVKLSRDLQNEVREFRTVFREEHKWAWADFFSALRQDDPSLALSNDQPSQRLRDLLLSSPPDAIKADKIRNISSWIGIITVLLLAAIIIYMVIMWIVVDTDTIAIKCAMTIVPGATFLIQIAFLVWCQLAEKQIKDAALKYKNREYES